MKLKAIILVLLITLSMGAEHNNRCHNLVSEELAEITSLEIGEVLDPNDVFALLPLKNDFCEGAECLGHRLCYTSFSEFVDHGDYLSISVRQSTDTILNFLDTLQGQYQLVQRIEANLTSSRNEVRSAQAQVMNLEAEQADAQKQLDSDQAQLDVLSKKITDRKVQWETRIETLSVSIQRQDESLRNLEAHAQLTFEELVKELDQIKIDFPDCWAALEPMWLSIDQMWLYMTSLNENNQVVEDFKMTVEKFRSFYMGILVSTFGQEFASNVNLNDLQGWITGQVESQAQNVAQIEQQFKRSFSSSTTERQARFKASSGEFNMFVTGFTYVEEMQWYRASATSFYSWSAQLDVWIKEIYALQLSLEMMVNEWTIKIASKYNELETLDVREAELRNRVNELNLKMTQLSVSQQELTSQIAGANTKITADDLEYQQQVDTLEIELNMFTKSVTETCSASGSVGQVLISQITNLQREIESISSSITVEYDLLIEVESFVTSQEVFEWSNSLEDFARLWSEYYMALTAFHSKASEMWERGTYNRDELQGLADAVDSQKQALLSAWQKPGQLYTRLNGMFDAVNAGEAQAEQGGEVQAGMMFKQQDVSQLLMNRR